METRGVWFGGFQFALESRAANVSPRDCHRAVRGSDLTCNSAGAGNYDPIRPFDLSCRRQFRVMHAFVSRLASVRPKKPAKYVQFFGQLYSFVAWPQSCSACVSDAKQAVKTTGLNSSEEAGHGKVLGGAGDHHVVSDVGPDHRVGHVRVDTVLPGDRDGRRKWWWRLDDRKARTGDRCKRRLFASARKGGTLPPSLVFLFVALVAWGSAVAQEKRSLESNLSAGLYRRPLGNDPATLDPARISDSYSRSVAQQLFDGLVQFDQTLTISPALAQFWKSSRDGLIWTFTLRKGVRFHHGRELTADDVAYSLSRILDPKTRSGAADLFIGIKGAEEFRSGRASNVAGIKVLSRHTVEVTLSEAFAPFASVLAVGHAKIVPRDLVEQQGEAFGMHPVGTGPFTFVRWDRSKEIMLTANPAYFDGAPKIAQLVYRIFPGEDFEAMYSEFAGLRLEDSPIPTSDYRRILGSPNQIYVKRPLFSVRFYGFNTRVRPFNDRRVRQALIHAIDRATVIDETFLGRYIPARGILPPGTQGYNPKLRGYAYDLQKARDLLTEAGYPGGRGLPPIEIWSSVRDRVMVEHTQLRRYLEAVGLHPQFHYETHWPTFARLLGDGKLPVFLYAWNADVPDPDNFLNKLFHSRSPRNFFGYANAVVDDLLVTARKEHDLQRRVELYRRAEQMIIDDAPIIPFWHYTYERLFQPYVHSVEVNGLGDPYIPLRKMWLAPPR